MKLRFGRIFGFIAVAVLLILGFSLIMGSGPKKPTTAVNTPKPLIDYASTNATVSMTIKGIINSREEHREIKITVGRDSRSLEIIKGYNGHVIKDKFFGNDEAAFSEFLYALSYAQFTRKHDSDIKSELGICPTGNRYVFTLENNGRNISRLWTSTCSGIGDGTFVGNTERLLSIFPKQIPNYEQLTQRVRLLD